MTLTCLYVIINMLREGSKIMAVSSNEKRITLEDFKRSDLAIQVDYWTPFFLKKCEIDYIPASEEESAAIRVFSLSSENAFIRKSAWSHYKTPTEAQIDKAIKDTDSEVRAAVWGNNQWTPTAAHIDYVFKNEKNDKVFAELWDRRDWIPTEEQVEYAFFNSEKWALVALSGNPNYKLTNERIEFLMEGGMTADALWNRDDWHPTEDQIDYALTINKDAVILLLILRREDWERTPYLIEKGLSNGFNCPVSEWEPYRHVLESYQLKERVGGLKEPNLPGVAL